MNEAENLILIKGAIPGFPGAFVTVRTALTGVVKAPSGREAQGGDEGGDRRQACRQEEVRREPWKS